MIRSSLLALVVLAASSANADYTNLARYQKAVGSTWGWTLRPDLFATDGIASNFHRWRSTNTSGQWLEITYPRPVTIASAHLYTGVIAATTGENWANFKLQSHNGTTWVDIPGGARSSNTSLEVNVIFSQAVTSDKFRLLSTDAGSAIRSIREIAMFGPNVVGSVEQGYPIGTGVVLNLAHKRPAIASSIDTSNYAIKAVDGYVDDSSRWLCATGTTGQTLEIDLLSQEINGDRLHAIGSAHLYSGDFATSSGALSDFTLESWNGTAWVVIPGATITGNTSNALAITFSSAVVASKVRLVNNTTGSAKVAELLFFPPRTGGYPLGEDVQIKAPPTAKAEDFSDAIRHLRVSSSSLKLGLVSGNGVFTNDAAGNDALNCQLLLNHRDGSYRIRNVKSGHCLALADLSTAPNTLVIGETYTGMPHQCWLLDFVNATQFRLLNAYSGLALQSLGGSTTPGTALAVVTPGASSLQQWDTIKRAHYPKKGIAGSGLAFPSAPGETYMSYYYGKFQHTSWGYSWGPRDTFPFLGTEHTFNPMQWGDFFWKHDSTNPPLEGERVSMQSQGKPLSFLGFNEPDHTDQANMTVARAVALWPRLQSMDTPLVGPCPANPMANAQGFNWNAEFYTAANQLGYRVDYTPLHWYDAPNSNNMINKIKQLYALYGRPVWVTEFSSVRWGGTATWTHASNYNFMAEFMWRAENLPELARYSHFNWSNEPTSPIDPPEAPRGNAFDENGNLTPYGELYASWDGVAQVLTQKAYHLHNHGAYQRMQSPATGNTFSFVTPGDSSAGTQWFLVPGTTANTYRIKTTRDGRPLSRTSGTPAAMGNPGQEDTATEWTLVPVVSGANHDGWYYLQHPLTNQRLKNNGNGTCSMVATTDTTNGSKWRFIVPLTPDGGSSAPTLAATDITNNQPSSTVPTGTPVTYTITFSEDIDATTLTAADFGNSGTASITIGAITETSPGVFTVTVTPTSAGTLIFRVNAGAVITDVIGNAIDTSAAIASTATINVTPGNAAPVFAANPITGSAATSGTSYTATLAGSATDADSDPITYAKVSGPAWLSVSSNGSLTGTPTSGDIGANSFIISASDGIAAPVQASLNITVNAASGGGPATLGHVSNIHISNSTDFNISVYPGKASYAGTGAYAGVTGTFGDGTVEAYYFLKNQTPATTLNGADGAVGTPVRYAHDGSTRLSTVTNTGGTSFSEFSRGDVWTTTDPGTNFSGGGAANFGGAAETICGAFATTGTINISGFTSGTIYFLAGGYATSGQTSGFNLTMSGAGQPNVLASNSFAPTTSRNMYVQSFTFSNAQNYTTISYTHFGTTSGRSRIMGVIVDGVTSAPPSNSAPVWASNPITGGNAAEDTAYSESIASNATDTNNDPLTFAKVSGPAWLSIAANGALSGTPVQSNVGANSFTISVSDGIAPPVTAPLNIFVVSVNDVPIALAQNVTTNEDTALPITLAATDADGDSLSYAVVAQPANGTLSGTAPNLTYTPTSNYNGLDSFTFLVNDGTVNSATATVAITVTAVNDAPLANAQSVTTAEDAALAITLTASDVDGDALTYTIVSAPANGTLSGTAPNLSFTPTANFNGATSFTFRVNDGTVNSATSTVSITVTPMNDAPAAIAQSVTTAEDAAVSITLTGTDIDGSSLTYTIVTQPANGTLSGTAPNVTYTPTSNYTGPDSFTFKANDGTVDSATVTVSIAVTAVNDAPAFLTNPIVAVNGSEGTAYTGVTLAGSATDSDAGDTITFSKVSGPAWLSVASNGALSGTPPAGSTGLNSFVVRATDSASATVDATLEITVSGLPLPWLTADIGTGMLAGSVTHNAGTFTQAGSGIISGTSDKLRFTYQTLTGDGEITARITTLQNTGTNSRVGVMMRDTLASNSKMILMGMSGTNTFRWVRRHTTGGSMNQNTSSTATPPNSWVRLVRSGTNIIASRSTNGTTWTAAGTSTDTSLGATCYIGIAVSSGSNTTLNTSQFSNVTVTP